MKASLDEAKLEKVRTVGGKTIARCPACAESGGDAKGDHLFIGADGRFGCIKFPGIEGTVHRKRIFALAGTSEADHAEPQRLRLVKSYDYTDAAGNLIFQVCRYEPKDFRQRRPDHSKPDGWAWDMKGVNRVLYRLPAVLEAVAAGRPVIIVEGEKDADALAALGLCATCNAGGAGKWIPDYTDALTGAKVIIFPDKDDDGRRHAAMVQAALTGKAASVQVVELPDHNGQRVKDAADWIEAGGTFEEMQELVRNAPAWTPPTAPPETDTPPGLLPVEVTGTLDPVAATKKGTPYALTDLGNAERLVALYGASLRWDTARHIWRTWDGRRWAADKGLAINRLAANTARQIRLEAAAAPSGNGNGNDLGRDLFAWAVRSESRDRLAAMVEVSKALLGIAVAGSAFDADPWALNCLNGTIDLKTGTLRIHDQADLITKLVPVEYRPDAKDWRWEKFLADATGSDTELTAFLQVAAGYTLTGDTSEERLFLIHGPTAGGKSTFQEAQRATLGEYARTINPDLLAKQRDNKGASGASPELAGLAGIRMAAGSEMEQGREMAEALAKNLTGGEPITARHLYAEFFDFRPQFKLWLAVNHCPKVSAEDGAVWRRILRIGFEHTVPPERRDKTLKPYLRDPKGGAPAVLAWAVKGCLRWQREGLMIPAAVTKSTAAYREESDPLAAFMDDCLLFHPEAWTAWGDIWSAYCEHCVENGTGERYRVAPKRLQERLRGKGCRSDRRHEGRGWAGVDIQGDWKTRPSVSPVTPRDGIPQSFSTKGKLEKVSEVASQPTRTDTKPIFTGVFDDAETARKAKEAKEDAHFPQEIL